MRLNHSLLRPDETASGRGRKAVIEMRRAQRSFGDGLIAEEVDDLREVGELPTGSWTTRPSSQPFIRPWASDIPRAAVAVGAGASRSGPAPLILKHVRNWSYEVLEREVRAIWFRDFTRVGGGKMPDAKTMGRWGLAVAPEVIKQVHERLVKIANDQGVVVGRRMRVDTTVVETNIHYPTNSSCWGRGRVLTRVMKKITKIAGEVARIARPQPQRETAQLDIARRRAPGPASQERLKRLRQPLTSTSRWSDRRNGCQEVPRHQAIERDQRSWCWKACVRT